MNHEIIGTTIGIGRFIERFEIYILKLVREILDKITHGGNVLSYIFWSCLNKMKDTNLFTKLMVITLFILLFKKIYHKQRSKGKTNMIQQVSEMKLFFSKETLLSETVFKKDKEISKIKKLINENNKIREKFKLEKESIDDSFFKIVQMYITMMKN
jgi:hypothetical protein